MQQRNTGKKSEAVLGIDSSTNSMAWCLYNGKPMAWGKINFTGKNVYDKILDARLKSEVVLDEVESLGGCDVIGIESAIMVRSNDVAIKMAYVAGTIISTLRNGDNTVRAIAPISWQAYIGNKNYTRADKRHLIDLFPGRSKSWYRNKIREQRKQFTMDFFNERFDLNITDNDVGDAFGIALYVWENR